eukprot:1895968-Rhodomonas_salina.6
MRAWSGVEGAWTRGHSLRVQVLLRDARRSGTEMALSGSSTLRFPRLRTSELSRCDAARY